jgi:hypothetical protein
MIGLARGGGRLAVSLMPTLGSCDWRFQAHLVQLDDTPCPMQQHNVPLLLPCALQKYF